MSSILFFRFFFCKPFSIYDVDLCCIFYLAIQFNTHSFCDERVIVFSSKRLTRSPIPRHGASNAQLFRTVHHYCVASHSHKGSSWPNQTRSC